MKKLFILIIIVFCQIKIYSGGDDDFTLIQRNSGLKKPELNLRNKYKQYSSSILPKSDSSKKLGKLIQDTIQSKLKLNKVNESTSLTNINPLLNLLENLSDDIYQSENPDGQTNHYFPTEIISIIIKNLILYEIFQEQDFKEIAQRLAKRDGVFNLKAFIAKDILRIVLNSKNIFTLFRTNNYLSDVTFIVLVDIFKNTKISKQCLAIILSTFDIYSLKKTYDFGNSILKQILTKEEIRKDNNIFNRSDLSLAASLNCVEAVKQLIKYNADVNFKDGEDNSTPLMSATMNNNLTCAVILLKAGADVYTINDNNESAISLACSQNEEYYDLVQLLIEHLNKMEIKSPATNKKDAIINKINKEGVTPLINAIIRNYKKIVYLLIKNGADVNIVSASNCSPLFYAVQDKNLKIASILINSNADINYQGRFNLTPLIKATQQMDDQMVQLLIKSGANPTLKDDQNQSAGDYAKGNARILSILSLLTQKNKK